jgi:prevent-host-death family protein
MIETGVRELRDHLSEYLRRVRGGEQITITDRGRPIATLLGVHTNEATERAWSLVQQGLGEWSGGRPRGSSNPPRVAGRRAEEAVIEDRR